MKFLALFLPILMATAFAHASESCEATITKQMSQSLQDKKEVMTGQPIAKKYLSSTALFTVNSSAAYEPGKPTAMSTWAVFVQVASDNTCNVLNVVQDAQFTN